MESTALLDLVMVPLGLFVMACYHAWLLFTILRHPKRTVIGLNALARRRWAIAMMADPMKNGVLAIQTLRNNIMASTVLGTTAITLTSLISVFAGMASSSSSSSTTTTAAAPCQLANDNRIALNSSPFKFCAISLCFFLAFLCHVQAIRYYAHVSFLITVASSQRDGGGVSTAYVAKCLNRGSMFWSLGMRAFYISFTLFLWIFGPIPMFVCCVVMCGVLYFLDLTTESTLDLEESLNGEGNYDPL